MKAGGLPGFMFCSCTYDLLSTYHEPNPFHLFSYERESPAQRYLSHPHVMWELQLRGRGGGGGSLPRVTQPVRGALALRLLFPSVLFVPLSPLCLRHWSASGEVRLIGILGQGQNRGRGEVTALHSYTSRLLGLALGRNRCPLRCVGMRNSCTFQGGSKWLG